jgi:hypothetical protein
MEFMESGVFESCKSWLLAGVIGFGIAASAVSPPALAAQEADVVTFEGNESFASGLSQALMALGAYRDVTPGNAAPDGATLFYQYEASFLAGSDSFSAACFYTGHLYSRVPAALTSCTITQGSAVNGQELPQYPLLQLFKAAQIQSLPDFPLDGCHTRACK